MRILYLIHTPWDWILQRPQLIALEIEKRYDCVVADRKYYPVKKSNLRPNTQPKRMKTILQIRGRKNKIIDWIDDVIYKIQLGNVNKYDCIWVCYPSFYKFIPLKYRGKVIYDCMDNHVALAKNQEEKKRIFDQEQQLIGRADIVFASSQTLIDTIPNMKKAMLVRNGYIGEDRLEIKNSCYKEKYIIGYFGAIESWFDFKTLKKVTNTLSSIVINLIGPFKKEKFKIEDNITVEALENDNIHFLGTVDHSMLAKQVEDYDALIMPFIVNDVILSVDPVKLYEYISYGKPVISVYYPEIERFRPYVYFYETADQLLDIIKELVGNGFKPKYTDQERAEFLSSNTWEKRGEVILQSLT